MLDVASAGELIRRILDNLERVIVGKPRELRLLLTGILAGGHILLDDIPGVGKTTLAKALARSVGGRFSRIQFTPDLLPTDIVGASIYNPKDGAFHYRPGPIFANVLLADELNRASPRTQSALLEGMAEKQVTVDGTTRPLEAPFVVIATQNPVETHGTYPLPEAQLDRFAMELRLGYPSPAEEKRILNGEGGAVRLAELAAVAGPAELAALQRTAAALPLPDGVADYVLALAAASREHPALQLGLSPRGSLALAAAARAWALADGRDHPLPDDVKAVAGPSMAHRLVLDTKARYAGVRKPAVVEELLGRVPVPR